jgi:hypothetical protein
MNANELRLGNWLLFRNMIEPDRYVQVDNWFWRSLFSLAKRDEQVQITAYYSPIPLTPEILERAGFIQHHNNCYNDRLYIKGIFGDGPYEWGFYPFGGRAMNSRPLAYLHQLQNLHFAITGEELIIKL